MDKSSVPELHDVAHGFPNQTAYFVGQAIISAPPAARPSPARAVHRPRCRCCRGSCIGRPQAGRRIAACSVLGQRVGSPNPDSKTPKRRASTDEITPQWARFFKHIFLRHKRRAGSAVSVTAICRVCPATAQRVRRSRIAGQPQLQIVVTDEQRPLVRRLTAD